MYVCVSACVTCMCACLLCVFVCLFTVTVTLNKHINMSECGITTSKHCCILFSVLGNRMASCS